MQEEGVTLASQRRRKLNAVSTNSQTLEELFLLAIDFSCSCVVGQAQHWDLKMSYS